MNQKKRVLAISGSTRAASSNLALIGTIARLCEDLWDVVVYEQLVSLPQFNPDEDGAQVLALVSEFREMVAQADAVLICTPEYAAGVPGALKNALDWAVSTTIFTDKPVALITAASSGRRAHESLQGTLLIMGSLMAVETTLLISYVQTKISKTGEVLDVETMKGLERVIAGVSKLIDEGKERRDLHYLVSGGV